MDDQELALSSLAAIEAFERQPKTSLRAAAWRLLSGAIANALDRQWSETDMIELIQRVARERDEFMLEHP
jgi:hypothetical protein